MLSIFCLRLAVGLVGCLLLLAPGEAFREPPFVGPRFFRTQFLIVLGLACLALLFLGAARPPLVLVACAAGLLLAFGGSISYALEGGPGGRALIILTLLSLSAALSLVEWGEPNGGVPGLLGGLTSAALLGAALSAMLLGHNYLISPAMSITPLFRLLVALLVSLGLRMLAEGLALYWTGRPLLDKLTGDGALWLPVRWGVGFLAPLVLCWMAWQTARIRSTQSATGILYVVVIFCFLGELTGQLLRGTGTTL